jgi:hypothetical protein
MKKWFEWQQQHFDPGDDPESYYYCNLVNETQCIRDWIEHGEVHRSQSSNYKLHQHEEYKKSILNQCAELGLDPATVIEWIDDPEYVELFNNQTQGSAAVPDFIKKVFVRNARSKFNINWDTAEIILTITRPGDLIPLHFDNFTTYEVKGQVVNNRWIVMLYDQLPGQCFMANNEYVSWCAGDTIGWNRTNYSHGSANFGYHDRYSLCITAEQLSA